MKNIRQSRFCPTFGCSSLGNLVNNRKTHYLEKCCPNKEKQSVLISNDDYFVPINNIVDQNLSIRSSSNSLFGYGLDEEQDREKSIIDISMNEKQEKSFHSECMELKADSLISSDRSHTSAIQNNIFVGDKEISPIQFSRSMIQRKRSTFQYYSSENLNSSMKGKFFSLKILVFVKMRSVLARYRKKCSFGLYR